MGHANVRQHSLRDAPALPVTARYTGDSALAVPLVATFLIVALSLLPSVRSEPNALRSLLGAAAAMLVWTSATLVSARRRGRRLAIEIILRPQHYLQACAHTSILLYWGWYWREVYHAAPLIAAQLAFAFAFDALLTWSRRDTYALGFGPFPIVFSTNLFLLFKPHWFYLQFLMVAVGFAAKELIRWKKEGRTTHIFNPSSFTLSLFSVGLILTGTSGITWGQEISETQFNPPHIYLLIFLVSLPAQLLFGTATMTLSAVATTWLFGLGYFMATGTHYWFPVTGAFSEPIPIAVFLGMHLLFTDPSTSPRTELGRIVFGMLYGLSVVALISILIALKLPGFYDKLLPVPILNLTIRGIDGMARSKALKRFDPGAIAKALLPRQRNLVYVSLWAIFFAAMQFMIGSQATLIRGDVLMRQNRLDEGIMRYREFVTAEPEDATGYRKLGTALMQKGQFADAAQSLRRSVDLQPSPDTLNNLGAALMQSGQTQEAVASFQHAIALEPATELAHDNLGLALMQAGRFEEAATSFQRVADLAPSSADAHRKLAVALLRAGHAEAAVAPLQRAAVLQPAVAEIHSALGETLIQAGRFAEALPPLRRAVTLKPNYPEAHYDIANALASLGDRKQAMGELHEALRLRPGWPQAMAALDALQATPAKGEQ